MFCGPVLGSGAASSRYPLHTQHETVESAQQHWDKVNAAPAKQVNAATSTQTAALPAGMADIGGGYYYKQPE